MKRRKRGEVLLSMEDLDHLLIQISKKDMEAFEKYYREISKAVYGLAYVLTKSSHDSEDIMQNTFIKVWEKAGTYHPGSNAKAWTMRIARNLALTKYRENKRFVELDFEIPSEDVLDKTINSQELDHLLTTLKKEEREIVVLYAIGFSHKEISVIMKKPYATIRWKYRYAINKLSLLERRDDYERA
jgi:RNA polymerase sigma-70 factor, ECF subfamily